MSAEQIATPVAESQGNATEVVSGPATTEEGIPAACSANPDTTSADPIHPENPDWTKQATRHLRNIARLEHQQHTTRRAFDTEIQRLEDARDETVGIMERQLEWHRAPLRQLHRALLTEDPKWKTVKLPYGELASRTPKTPTVRIHDREAFTDWAHVNAPHLLEVRFSPDRKGIGAAIGDTLVAVGTPTPGAPVSVAGGSGELVPGLVLGLDDTTFSIRIDGEL